MAAINPQLPHFQADLWTPAGAQGQLPLILFLHGSGERGADLELVREHGPPCLAPRFGLDRFLILSPQCPVGVTWDVKSLDVFIKIAINRFDVDPARVYLTGLSMGGQGAWELVATGGVRFAAVALMCVAPAPANVAARIEPLSETPTWLFHSAADNHSVSVSDDLFDALKRVNAPVSYTRYRNLSHSETWARAYGSKHLYDWFLEQPLRPQPILPQRSSRPQQPPQKPHPQKPPQKSAG